MSDTVIASTLSTFALLRGVTRGCGRTLWPHFVHVPNPWEGAEHLYAILDRGGLVTDVENIVLVRGGQLLCVRGLSKSDRGMSRISTTKELPRNRGRAVAEIVAGALKNGWAWLSPIVPGVLREPERHSHISTLNRVGRLSDIWPEMAKEEQEQVESRLATAAVTLCARAHHAWCRAVERHCNPAVLAAVHANLGVIDPQTARIVRNARDGLLRGQFPGSVRYDHDRLAVLPRERVSQHLPHPKMLEHADRFSEILAAGSSGARAWSDLRATWPWLVHQVLVDIRFMRAMLAGKPLAPLLERRLGLTRAERRSWEVAVPGVKALYQGNEGRTLPGSDHPVLGRDVQVFDSGQSWRKLAMAISLLPDRMRPSTSRPGDGTLPLLPLRACLLERMFDRIWFSPGGDGLYHPRQHLPAMSRSLAPKWRLRAPLYALRNMKAMVAHGGLRLDDLSPERLDDLVGLAEDVHNMRVWCLVQTVGAEIARSLNAQWEANGRPDCGHLPPALETRTRRILDAAGGLPGDLGAALFALGAPYLFSARHEPALYAAFSDVALPRSLKRLRRTVDRFHQLLAARGMDIARGRAPLTTVRSWPPLFEEGRVALPEHPGLVAVCLTSTEMLAEEGRAMRHCVGSYGSRCQGGANHILSIRDADGQRLSTLHIEIAPNRASGPSAFFQPKVTEHRGQDNKPPLPAAVAFVADLAERFAAPGMSGLVLTKDALRPRCGTSNLPRIEHDPWAADAAEREDEVYRVLADGSFTPAHAQAFAERLVDRPFGWVRPRLP